MNTQDFSIELKFLEGKDEPLKVFDSFRLMIESQLLIQTELLLSANPIGHISFTLAEIKKASILARIVRKYIDIESDKELFDTSSKGNMDDYINQSNKIILSKLSDASTNPITKTDIKNMIAEINTVADETGVKASDNFKLPTEEKIIESIEKAKQATDILPDRKYIFKPQNEEIVISKVNLNIIDNPVVDNITPQNNRTNMILKIKLADFLGESKWKFITPEKAQIDAKILDKDWLEKFHHNDEQLASGDSLDVELEIKENENQKHEYNIIKINKVINNEQQRKFKI